MRTLIATLLCIFAIAPASAQVPDTIFGSRIRQAMDANDDTTRIAAWIHLSDKAPYFEDDSVSYPTNVLSDRALKRRAKVLTADTLIDYSDLPVNEHYIATIRAHVAQVRFATKWFNAVSVLATRSELKAVARLPFVTHISHLTGVTGPGHNEPRQSCVRSHDHQLNGLPAKSPFIPNLDYGDSRAQINQIGVDSLHAAQLYGKGIFVAIFDTGFPGLKHDALSHLNVIATYDFLEDRERVWPEPGECAQGNHGSMVLSTMAAHMPGKLIGPAFGASYILARTEDTRSETPYEEEAWLRAIEWADSIGVDIVNTSLGYLDYDRPFRSYTATQMNGDVALITRAADMAAQKGILIVTSAGNSGRYGLNTLGAPADADSVLTVGAVTSSGTRTYFSSVGPSNNARRSIKPDVVAMGVEVASITPGKRRQTSLVDGTSFSSPLTAAAGALFLQAAPSATPMDIIQALRATASQSNQPDNTLGWGIINVAKAIRYYERLHSVKN